MVMPGSRCAHEFDQGSKRRCMVQIELIEEDASMDDLDVEVFSRIRREVPRG